MATTTPKKPTLDKLKGGLILTNEQREKYEIEDGLLLNEVRDWSNIKKLIESYFQANKDTWIETADEFAQILIKTFDDLSDKNNNSYKGQDACLQRYCISLKHFFENKNIKQKVKKLYTCNLLIATMKKKERSLMRQSRSTAVMLAEEQSQNLEEEAQIRVQRKRKHVDEENIIYHGPDHQEDTCQSPQSFDSVERHPQVQSYYDYFADDHHEKWTITTENSWISINGMNITEAMHKYRYESYRAAKLLYSISPERILSLSFIFVFDPDEIQGFIKNCENEIIFIRNELNLFTQRRTPDEAVIITNTLDNLSVNKDDCNRYIAVTHGAYYDEDMEMTTYYNVISAFHQYTSILHDHHTEPDHNSYEFFTQEIFKSSVYTKHKISKPLEGCSKYIPDFKLSFEYQKEKFADLFIMEIKKDDKDCTPDADDIIKINLELQVMLNQLILLNVAEPVAYGIVIKEHESKIYQMTFKNGIYISYVTERFYLPRNAKDVCLVPRVITIFLTLKDMLDKIIIKIKNRKRGTPTIANSIKRGMGLPCPIKDAMTFYLRKKEITLVPP
ncbi:hypothetical protein AB4K20DRAFT_1636385 [Rhizopus microsporus]|uniref:Uncharacterized protein n=1 Tax=Rhizopus microsporus TaxID=58291 RepID=A0A1X0RJX9_RHIZD|nr:hypothetical protein BCV71DRAFT_282160 [Rhizopus microsporus]